MFQCSLVIAVGTTVVLITLLPTSAMGYMPASAGTVSTIFNAIYAFHLSRLKGATSGDQWLQDVVSLRASSWISPTILLAVPVICFMWSMTAFFVFLLWFIYEMPFKNTADSSGIIPTFLAGTTAVVGVWGMVLFLPKFLSLGRGTITGPVVQSQQ